jgi:hypothetical protein
MDMPASPQRVRSAVQGGVGFLTEEMLRWKQDRNCASCHHAAQMIWAVAEAKTAGYAVNDAALAEVVSWSLAADNRSRIIAVPNKPEVPQGLSLGAAYVALATASLTELSADDLAGRQRLIDHLLAFQGADGGWAPSTARPPLFEGGPVSTLVCKLALGARPADTPEIAAAVAAAQEKSAACLASQLAPPSQQVLCLELILAVQEGADSATTASRCEALLALQQPDGGWRQTLDRSSDAFATGQAVYALRRAGVPADDARLARGAAWLVNRQSADGSWPTRSRPMPDGGKSATNEGPITFTSTGWATMALARCAAR